MLVYARYFKPEAGGYGGKDYLFKTEMPLVAGDLVIAPSWKGEQKAIITRTHVQEADLPGGLLDAIGKISEITKLDPGEEGQVEA